MDDRCVTQLLCTHNYATSWSRISLDLQKFVLACSISWRFEFFLTNTFLSLLPVHVPYQICNLPDHPIHAGCTAIVAVLIGRTLTIANAGDSRAVLCRAGGRTEALSIDHKPHQDREMSRITKAGGFVNQFGRVNGNLNLSRSIGDLKYKQIPGLTPAEQMITADPDIVQ